MAADKKTVENGPGRDSGGRFVPGCAAGPGRPCQPVEREGLKRPR